MKKYTLILLLLFSIYTGFAQFRYTESIFSKVDTLKDVEYAQADFLDNKIGLLSEYNIHEGENRTSQKPLYMDIFMPHADTVTKRPAIIFAHSGAFLIGSRKADDMIAFCDSFARRGYVTATIDYRMGMGSKVTRTLFGLLIINIAIEDKNGYRAAYRAGQDSRAAIRYLKHNANLYGIDTTKIYFAGSSAGGILGLYNIYNDTPGEYGNAILENPYLGAIDHVGVQGYDGQADAVVSMWGAVQETRYIENDTTPVFLIHGTKDPIVPFQSGVPLDSIIPKNDFLTFSIPETYGSYCIDTALTNRNIHHKTYFLEGGIHEFYGTDTGTFYEEGPNQYWDTIQYKMTGFFFYLFKPEAKIGYYMNNLELTFYDESEEAAYTFWDYGDGTNGTGKVSSHNYEQKGIYKVTLTTCNQNMACDSVSTHITAGIIDNVTEIKSQDIILFPNPVTESLYINGIFSSFDFNIYDLTGRIHMQEKHFQSKFVDVSSLQNGIYILRLSFDNQLVIRKFIKTN